MRVDKSIVMNIERLRKSFPNGICADFVLDKFKISDKDACICFFNGLTDSNLLLKVHRSLLTAKPLPQGMSELSQLFVPLTDKKTEGDIDKAIHALLSSMSLLFIDGYDEALILDTKEYPSRSIEEP